MMNILFQKNFQRVFGTYPLTGAVLRDAILTAAEIGYRSFDTAQMYGNEADTGLALKETGLERAELCIITKIHPDHFSADRFFASLEKSLEDLGTDYIDVLFLHWPPTATEFEKTLALLAEAKHRKHVKFIGVSNFTCAMMEAAQAQLDIPIAANQVEFHPLLNQSQLLAAAQITGIPLMSYSAVARGKVFDFPLFHEIGKHYEKTAAQIVLRWVLQKGVIANSMSTQKPNITDNFNIMDFTLSSVDMARIDALQNTNYRIVTKEVAPWAPDWD